MSVFVVPINKQIDRYISTMWGVRLAPIMRDEHRQKHLNYVLLITTPPQRRVA